MEEPPDVATLIEGLVSESESVRKYAVFKLQGLLGDPSFADAFIQGGGLLPLRQAVLDTGGNTQAYALGSWDALLELDTGWDAVDGQVIEKVVALAATHPLVNIVRNALTLLVLVVSRPSSKSGDMDSQMFGFKAIKPALESYPTFLESLVQRLSASDHKLCANALQLVNALMRDAVTKGGENEWPRFIKRLQDLGVIGGVGMLMRGDAASDPGSPLATSILEFQSLTKVLLRKWKEVRVNVELAEHKRALKTIHLLSKPEPYHPETTGDSPEFQRKSGRRHHPEKWRRLGFETESPAWEFDETGYLGIMDLVDYTRRHEDVYQKTLMEQSVQPREQRCPLARASLSVTLILYEHFEIDDTPDVDETAYPELLDIRADVDQLYKPLLLQWGRLHTAALNAFLRLWKVASAEAEDFFKIEELIRIVVDRIVGSAGRKTDVAKVEEDLRSVTLETARQWQMTGLDEVYKDAWGPHLVQVREQLHYESMQFMKEQRARCLLQGSWFPTAALGSSENVSWRFVRLSHNRRWLHYQNYSTKGVDEPPLTDLPEKLDLNTVTSVDSNVSTADAPLMNGNNSSTETLRQDSTPQSSVRPRLPTPLPATNTKISIIGHPFKGSMEENVLLELFPQTSYEASEWLDGMLMLLNQQPITKDTTRLIEMMEDWGVRLRMLNLRWEDVDWEALEQGVRGEKVEAREVPSREGLDDDCWYAMPET
ncbi:ELMO2 protein [Teratosphaeria destructans]|uniref:ELMO2 protein n=1 Tax=Teratosphaeria destructans TaxID=418781 RepID=A0A9W7SJS6_9PEZI|nr:ELMO2 protein [Teratosphaeria destructans]